MYYIAYGSNINLSQMKKRCPDSRLTGVLFLNGWRLLFCRVATVEKDEKAQTPAAVWEISKEDEKALDIYEGFPHLYGKQYKTVKLNGKKLKCMFYTLNVISPSIPTASYLDTIKRGYDDTGLDCKYLKEALEYTNMKIQQT